MEIKQFEDKNLAHYSYAILSEGEIVLIDPSRNPKPYYDFAKENDAVIKAVIETHPHADFVSSHAEIQRTTNANIFVSKFLGAEYTHNTFDEGDIIKIGKISLSALNTPGHSPDSICVLAMDDKGKPKAIFTGDTLFIGDCGRPDLREEAGAITAAREELARQMYHSLRNKLIPLPNDVVVYPAHGAGSLCGKALSNENKSTIGAEKIGNWSLQPTSESAFVAELLAEQPFVPKYFPFNVALNKKGADAFAKSISEVKHIKPITNANEAQIIDSKILTIDTRPQQQFKKAFLKNSINLMNDTKFETWLGSIVNPNEPFYLAAESELSLNTLIDRTAKIGYEKQIVLAFVIQFGNQSMEQIDNEDFKSNQSKYTIVDIRNYSEVKARKIFDTSIHIPLHELRERALEIPTQKPIVVQCAGGYRSAAGATILKSILNHNLPIFDLSEAIKQY